MATPFKPELTDAGRLLLAKVVSGSQLAITKGQLGTGKLAASAPIGPLTALIAPVVDTGIATGTAQDQETVVIGLQYTNTGLAEGFGIAEIGVFAREITAEGPGAEILYCYLSTGDNTERIEPETSGIFTRAFDIPVIVGVAASVTVTVNPAALVTQGDLQAMLDVPGGIAMLNAIGVVKTATGDISGTDLHAITQTGFYHGSNVANAIDANPYYFIVLCQNANNAIILSSRADVNNPEWFVQTNVAGVWSWWINIDNGARWNSMPKTGGDFTGKVTAAPIDSSGPYIHNTQIVSSTGAAVNRHKIVFYEE